jgi:hypothetical protein
VRHLLLASLVAGVTPAGAGALERHVPGDYATVTAALNAAQAGDVIVVGPGVFPLATSRSGIQITIRGAGMNATVLDGSGTTILALADSTLAIEDLTLRDGSDGVGASGSQVSLDSVRVELCSDGVDMSDSSLVVVDSEFVGNSDDGIDLDDQSSLACLRCTITDNGDDGIEVRLHDFVGPTLEIEVASSRIERNEEVGIQLIDYPATTARSFYFHDLVVANNALGGITWQCCGDTEEDLEGWPGPEPVLIERATIVGNGGPGVEGGASGAMQLRDSIVWQNTFDLYQVGGPLGTNLVGVDPLFSSDFRLSPASPARGAAENGGDLGAYPYRQCSDGSDNDGDAAVDLADADCSSLDDASERPPAPWGCGFGPELAPVLGGLALSRRVRARRRAAR